MSERGSWQAPFRFGFENCLDWIPTRYYLHGAFCGFTQSLQARAFLKLRNNCLSFPFDSAFSRLTVSSQRNQTSVAVKQPAWKLLHVFYWWEPLTREIILRLWDFEFSRDQDVAPSGLEEMYGHFRCAYCLHRQGDLPTRATSQRPAIFGQKSMKWRRNGQVTQFRWGSLSQKSIWESTCWCEDNHVIGLTKIGGKSEKWT
jgi:hypothetical protein